MKNKLFLMGILVMALVLGMTVVGCAVLRDFFATPAWYLGTYSGNVVVGVDYIRDGSSVNLSNVRIVEQGPLSGHPTIKWAYVYVGDKKYGVVWDRGSTNSGFTGVELGMGYQARSAFDFYNGPDKNSIFDDISTEAPSIKVVKY